jgi:hypothetical protein
MQAKLKTRRCQRIHQLSYKALTASNPFNQLVFDTTTRALSYSRNRTILKWNCFDKESG